jgi:hypothetical protein
MCIISYSEKADDKLANQLGARDSRQQKINFPKRYVRSKY